MDVPIDLMLLAGAPAVVVFDLTRLDYRLVGGALEVHLPGRSGPQVSAPVHGTGPDASRAATFAALDALASQTVELDTLAGEVAALVGLYNPATGKVTVGDALDGYVFRSDTALEVATTGEPAVLDVDGDRSALHLGDVTLSDHAPADQLR